MKKIIALRLTDGREIISGPRVIVDEESIGKNGYKVVINIDDHGCEAIVAIFYPLGDVALPLVQVLHKELWPKKLLDKVIQVIGQQEKSRLARKYIIAQVSDKFRQKKIDLGNGYSLVGNLWHCLESSEKLPAAYMDLLIVSEVKQNATGNSSYFSLFTVENLCAVSRQKMDIKPCCEQPKRYWCKKTEQIVTEYLKLLAHFSKGILREQISEIANGMSADDDWKKRCRKIFQTLLKFGPEIVEYPAYREAIRIIEEAGESREAYKRMMKK